MDAKKPAREIAIKGALGLLIGLSLLAGGVWAGRQLHIVWNIWPSVDGVVVSGIVEDVVDVPSAKGGTLIHRYRPEIEFRYVVSGKPYTTRAASEYTADTYQKAAANLLSLYAPGTHHPIRYNPRNPRDIRFGIIELGPLVFSFLLLVAGVVLSAGGVNSLALAYSQRVARAPTVGREAPATVLPFEDRSRVEPAAATLHCPACGRRVQADQDTCPNCFKSLRAA
jgi:hypothetical protein